jgi:hypothetical protein
MSGGNPVPGASSTLGMRIGSWPRVTVGLRWTSVVAEQYVHSGTTETRNEGTRSVSVDGAIGLFSGFTIAPALGGVGSVDLLLSAGKVTRTEAFTGEPPSYAAGVRIGVLRESFTTPGVSVSANYRKVGDFHTGLASPRFFVPPMFEATGNRVLSLRFITGKRLFGLGANVGVGYDMLESEVQQFDGESSLVDNPDTSREPYDLKQNRVSAFANISWTMMIANVVAEGGLQRGGREFTQPLPEYQESLTQQNSYFGSLAIRLAL